MAAASGWPIDLACGGLSLRVHSLWLASADQTRAPAVSTDPTRHVVAIGGPRSKCAKLVRGDGGDGRLYIPPDTVARAPWGPDVVGAEPEAAGLVVLLGQQAGPEETAWSTL